jgi:Ca-activated chloride channel family protein
MGNAAFLLKKYDKAKQLYINALLLGEDKDALYNLNLIKRLHLKSHTDVAKMLPKKEPQQEKKATNKQEKKNSKKAKASAGSSGSSKQSSTGNSQTKKQQTQRKTKQTRPKANNYKLGYKVYEQINKGYSNEKEPW